MPLLFYSLEPGLLPTQGEGIEILPDTYYCPGACGKFQRTKSPGWDDSSDSDSGVVLPVIIDNSIDCGRSTDIVGRIDCNPKQGLDIITEMCLKGPHGILTSNRGAWKKGVVVCEKPES